MRTYLAFFQMQRGSLLNDGGRSGRFSKSKKRRESILNLKEKKIKNVRKKNSALYGDLFVCFTYIFICKRFLSGNSAELCVYVCVWVVVCTERARPCREEFFLSYFSLFFFFVYRRHLTEEKTAWAVLMPHFIFLFLFFSKNLLPALWLAKRV